ncbi:MAG: efflux RND transporter permease subunit [Treponema sp.]|jgi:multidrug efflux pump subunit AcrB|nr:efflux RND transporter permease subunit [Treponema sp.]
MNIPGGGFDRRLNWLDRKKASLCICFGLCALSVFIIAFPGNPRRGGQGASYTVTLRHYGVDVREMERSAAIPLEDALAAIQGVRGVVSSSENGRVRAFVRFDRKKPGQYEAVREAAQSVYEGLPSSAQRPEILSSDNSRIPVWSAAVIPGPAGSGAYTGGNTAALLERIVKPKLESLEGAGEVEISGAGLMEITVVLKPDKAAALGLGPQEIAAVLGNNDLLLPGGRLEKDGREILLTVDGRYEDLSGLTEALIPLGNGRTARLGDIASVYEQEREPDTLSRLNGKKAAVISVMGSAGADLGKLSRRIKAALDETGIFTPPARSLELIVLSDRGAEETAAYRSVLIAALKGSLAVALMVFLLRLGKQGGPGTGGGGGLICAFAVPGVCLFSAALLSLFGFPLDRPVLGGIAAGLGAAVDAAILCSEGLRFCRNTGEARAALGRLKVPLISGSVTTAVSLLPLGAVESMAGGIAAMAWAIGMVNITALVFSLILLPPLFLWGMEYGRKVLPDLPRKRGPANFRFLSGALQILKSLSRRVLRAGHRFLAADLRCCIKHPGMVLAGGLLISAAGVLAILMGGTDPESGFSGDSVFAQVEFDGGLRARETDRLLADYAERLLPMAGIKNIQTSARTASGSVLISFDGKKIKAAQVRESARTLAISGGFVYFPESSPEERNWEIKINGDDDRRCRELAIRAAALCAALPPVKEGVLNFKDGSGRITLIPDRERLAESGLAFSTAAGTARWGVHGPVAYKRMGPRGEIDVRIRGTDPPSREEVLGILAADPPDEGGEPRIPLRLDSLMNVREGREPASIRRENRRRTASISIRTGVMDPRRVRKEVMGALKNLELPRGYTVEFDPEAISRAEALSGTVLRFLLALVFCYMVIASVHESFGIPLAVLSVVPPSLAFPALCLALTGALLNPAAACAFVAVSGMAVNASVLSAGGLIPFLEFLGSGGKTSGKNSGGGFVLYRGIREKVPALLATSGTTVAGAAPFLFLREGANTLVRTLALVSALGVGASCLCSLCIIPALAVKYPKIFKPFSKPG